LRRAAECIHRQAACAALIKGGHLEGEAIDVLYDGDRFTEFRAARLETAHTHGTGCTYSAAITACLAAGIPLAESVARAKNFVHQAIRTNPGLGHGSGPVNHHASPL
jgi:hydroxymethylpyrimidine/phosphomethylpyrimidine kinase